MGSTSTVLITIGALIVFGVPPAIADGYGTAGRWLVTQSMEQQGEIPFACFLERNVSPRDFYLYLMKDRDELVLEVPLDAALWKQLSPIGPSLDVLVAFDGKRIAVNEAAPSDEDGALLIPAGDTEQFLNAFAGSSRMIVTARGVKLLDLQLSGSAAAVQLLQGCKAAYETHQFTRLPPPA